MKKIFQIALFALLFTSLISAQSSITLLISDSASSSLLSDTKAELIGLSKIKFSSDNGKVIFENLQPGNYICRVTLENYFSKEVSISLTDQPVFMTIQLQPFESATDTIDVRAKFFKRSDNVSTSYSNTFAEEIRKTPGAVEDVIRYFISSPGVSVGRDLYNDMIVRGGSPVENLTLIDGLEVQNPNHYGAPGSTSGALSYINLKLVDEVDFFTGGFPVTFGDRISSVMDIKFKEGNRKKHVRDINLSVTGFGVFLEGPLSSKTTYMLSARRSYLELVKEQLNMPLVPEYWDFNLKLNHNFSSTDKLNIIGLFATDRAKPFEEGDYMHDTVNIKILSSGINYIKQGVNFKYRLTAGYNWNFYKVDYQNYVLDINDNETYLKQEADLKLNKEATLTLFGNIKYIFSKYKIYNDGGFNSSNYYSPAYRFDEEIESYKLAGGANLTYVTPDKKLILNFGLRFDKFDYITEPFNISPRIGLSYKLTNKVFVNASYGVYFQAPELLWVTANESNKNLKSIKADSYVIEVEHFFSDNLRFSIEGYLKQYHFYPVSVYDPNFIFINSGVDLYPNFLDEAQSAGKGFFGGVDVTFQKKNPVSGLYWTLAYSLSRSKFLAMAGDIQPAAFDYHHQFTAIVGIKLKSQWSFSTRFKYAGGRPNTPYDLENSAYYGRGIFDKTQYNKSRLPEYIRMDVRIDKHLNIGKTRMLAYIEVQNIFNRENIFNYYWSYTNKGPKPNLHWSILPIIGLTYQF